MKDEIQCIKSRANLTAHKAPAGMAQSSLRLQLTYFAKLVDMYCVLAGREVTDNSVNFHIIFLFEKRYNKIKQLLDFLCAKLSNFRQNLKFKNLSTLMAGAISSSPNTIAVAFGMLNHIWR